MMDYKCNFGLKTLAIVGITLAMIVMFTWLVTGSIAMAQCPDDEEFTSDFQLENCKFKPWGKNPYFILRPGYRLVLEGDEEDEGEIKTVRVQITVLRKTKLIDLVEEGLGIVKTRVVEEKEWEDDELVEISMNWFAICRQTNAVYYFGESVLERDEDSGEMVPGGGAWEAGVDGAMPGLIMPGTFLLGSKYFQELAPLSGAMDRGENMEMGLTVETEAGIFDNCVMVVDTNPSDGVCDSDDGDEKIYCPGIGLVIDEEAELIEFGKARRCDFDHDDNDDDDD